MFSVIRTLCGYCLSFDWAFDLIAFWRVQNRKAKVLFYCDHAMNIYVIATVVEELENREEGCLVLLPRAAKNQCFPSNRTVRVSRLFPRLFMRRLSCRVFVTPASGLSREAMPKGARQCIHYPHSIVSFHMIYHDGAFDGYDTILACGSHHVREIQAMNQLIGVSGRRAIPVGYGKIDMQLRWKTEHQWENPHFRIAQNTVLIAPSWGQKNIIESMGLELVGKLREAGIGVTLRPHPGILRNNLQAVAEIRERFDSDDGFTYEDPSDKSASFFYSDLMISDYSGVAFEYAFVMERPVVFVEVPVKVFNHDFKSIDIEPIELGERQNLGALCECSADAVVDACLHLMSEPGKSVERIKDSRARILSNFGRAGKTAAEIIEELIHDPAG